MRDPQEALRDFYDTPDRAEDQLSDPLILNGRRVVPLVLAELPNKDMPRRRYAIAFLGNGKYESALPTLERILADDSEFLYFRADALGAIYEISPEWAQSLAPVHLNAEGLLGEIASSIVAGQRPASLSTRSYWEALWHVHR